MKKECYPHDVICLTCCSLDNIKLHLIETYFEDVSWIGLFTFEEILACPYHTGVVSVKMNLQVLIQPSDSNLKCSGRSPRGTFCSFRGLLAGNPDLFQGIKSSSVGRRQIILSKRFFIGFSPQVDSEMS